MPRWQLTQPNKNSRFCVSSRNLIFPVLRSSTTEEQISGNWFKTVFLSQVIPPPHPAELFQFSVTHKGNLQDSQEIGSPPPPLLLDTDRMVGAGAVDWESKPQRPWGTWQRAGAGKDLLSQREDFEMVSFSFFYFLRICLCNIWLINVSFWQHACPPMAYHSWGDRRCGLWKGAPGPQSWGHLVRCARPFFQVPSDLWCEWASVSPLWKKEVPRMFILRLIWIQVHILSYTAVGRLGMAFHWECLK